MPGLTPLVPLHKTANEVGQKNPTGQPNISQLGLCASHVGIPIPAHRIRLFERDR
jgi:hypothetical protein